MRVLFSCTEDTGHFHPLVPFALAARDAGHAVAFATPSMAGPQVAAAGFRHFVAGDGGTREEVFPESEALPGPEHSDFVQAHWFGGVLAERMAGDLLGVGETWPPDLIIRDSSCHGACVAAERLGIPHASVEINLVGRPVRRRGLLSEPLGRLRAAHGLAPDPNLAMLDRYLTLVPFPPSLRSPAAPFPTNGFAVRPFPFDRSGGEALPAWLAELPPRPLVYATLGTTPYATGRSELFETIIEALRDREVNLVVTLGRAGDPVRYGVQPANVRIERYIPQSLLFPQCDLVISHAGSGSLIAALAHGLPSVVMPLTADQPRNAERITALGLGIALDPHRAGPETIRDAVLEVLRTPSYREAAERVRDEISAMPGPEHAIALLEQLASRPEPKMHEP